MISRSCCSCSRCFRDFCCSELLELEPDRELLDCCCSELLELEPLDEPLDEEDCCSELEEPE